ncbi:MAG: phosphoribosylaminoimidazolesuccinocarboxamide synthase [Bacteroidota bacterium]
MSGAGNIEVLQSGKTKDLLQSKQAGLLIQQFKDGAKPASPGRSKASIANEVSAFFFAYLKGYKIPTHFVEKVSESSMLVQHVQMVPLTVTVWNVATKEFGKRFGVREWSDLSIPIIEHSYTAPGKSPQMVNEFHVYALHIATPEQLRNINRLTSKANIVLRSFFERRELRLAGVRFRFGVAGTQMMIADEISPATCRVIDMRKRQRNATPLTTLNGATTITTYIDFRNRVFGTA